MHNNYDYNGLTKTTCISSRVSLFGCVQLYNFEFICLYKLYNIYSSYIVWFCGKVMQSSVYTRNTYPTLSKFKIG